MNRQDDLDAFVSHASLGALDIRTSGSGPLAGLTFAVKDFFDVAGVPTGAGSPHWLASHPVPSKTAAVVVRALEAGARLVGKTHTDELAWSLNGENHHYGTPRNPAAPGRVPGGSSSGSAAATAGGLVDFAIGSDTGGSVRLPASYCGVYGIRTTHGRIPIEGSVPLAESYDSVGWFARDAETFARVGRVLLGPGAPAAPPRRVLLARDLFAVSGPAVADALAPGIARVASALGPPEAVDVAGEDLSRWRDVFRVLQAAEIWAAHGEWVLATKPVFGPGIRERFAAAARLEPEDVEAARAMRGSIRERMLALLGDDAVLILPSAPGIAPLCDTRPAELEDFRARALEVLCPAGHAGLPQVSLPLGTLDGCPIGLSLMAGPGRDEMLLDLAGRVMATAR